MKCCHRCGHPWDTGKERPGPKDFCESCSAYLHCCLNCRFHDPSLHNACAIPTTDWVGDKAGANFCDEFVFREHVAAGPTDDAAQARGAFDNIFGEPDTPSGEDLLNDFRNKLP